MSEPTVKTEDVPDRKASGYKSWKKKYRKMRITFDSKMHDGEELHKKEARASAMVKRLAVENDRLLDLLLEINNSPQIPTERRIDVDTKPTNTPSQKDLAIKRLEQLLSDVPHLTYISAKETQASYVTDLVAASGESYPANFLSADDIDNYIYAVDTAIDPDQHIPTLAPSAHPHNYPSINPHLKNPTSVTNWLRKHAPKVFLQDGESHGNADGEDGEGSGRKSRGGKAERGGRASTRGKRPSAVSRTAAAADRGDWDVSMDDDGDTGSTPAGKGKRKRDDDPGYRPKGGSGSRPTKKKRKSEGDGTPSVRKSKKDSISASKDD